MNNQKTDGASWKLNKDLEQSVNVDSAKSMNDLIGIVITEQTGKNYNRRTFWFWC